MSHSGELKIAKECSAYTGKAGDHCTITASNVDEIMPGATIVYAKAAASGALDTDVVLAAGDGNTANGHVTLDLGAGQGTVTFTGGTGTLAAFEARAAVSADAEGMWHWIGTYSLPERESAVPATA